MTDTATDHRLLYIAGAPGAGKTTLMTKLTDDYGRMSHRAPSPDQVSFDELVDDAGQVVGVELGVQRGRYSGTDALPASAVTAAVPWIASRPYPLVLAEGARLAHHRFLGAAADAGYAVTLIVLDHFNVQAWRGRSPLARDYAATIAARDLAARMRLHPVDAPGSITVVSGHPNAIDVLAAARHAIPGRSPIRG